MSGLLPTGAWAVMCSEQTAGEWTAPTCRSLRSDGLELAANSACKRRQPPICLPNRFALSITAVSLSTNDVDFCRNQTIDAELEYLSNKCECNWEGKCSAR